MPAELTELLFFSEVHVEQVPPICVLPDGMYRVVCGELFHIVDGVPPDAD